MARAEIPLATIEAGPVAGVAPWKAVPNGLRMIWGTWQAERIMAQFEPDVAFMTGGYVNVPVALAARRRRVPALVFLPDVEPGAAIRFVSRFCTRIACTSEASRVYFPADKTVVTGYPVRQSIRAARELSRLAALARFDLEPGRPTLFVFGGSRGARSINRALLAGLPELLNSFQVIHVSGHLDWGVVEEHGRRLAPELRPFYRPYAYLHDEMGAAFRAADLVVARAGASMLGECPAFGLPAVLVPYPHAWRYQKVNADFLADRGAAVRLDDERLPAELIPTIRTLLDDKAQLARMAAAAANLDVPDAASQLAEVVVNLANRPIGQHAEKGASA